LKVNVGLVQAKASNEKSSLEILCCGVHFGAGCGVNQAMSGVVDVPSYGVLLMFGCGALWRGTRVER